MIQKAQAIERLIQKIINLETDWGRLILKHKKRFISLIVIFLLLVAMRSGISFYYSYMFKEVAIPAVPNGIARNFEQVKLNSKNVGHGKKKITLPFAPRTIYANMDNGPLFRLGLDASQTPELAARLLHHLKTAKDPLTLDASAQALLKQCGLGKGLLENLPDFHFLIPPSPIILACSPAATCQKMDGYYRLDLVQRLPGGALNIGQILDLVWPTVNCKSAAGTALNATAKVEALSSPLLAIKVTQAYLAAE